MIFRLLVALIAGLPIGTLAAQKPVPSRPPTPSEELNRRLPGWLCFSGEYRLRVEGFSGGGFRQDNQDAYLLSRLRINMKIQPAGWMKLVFQGQDSRVFWNSRIPAATPYHDAMDLRMGFLELGDAENRPASLRVGRQELAFGEQRLIGPLNWTNTARSFDAVRATFRHRGYRLDAFAASVVNIRPGELNKRIDGNNLHGLYGGIEKLAPKATIEPYVLWRVGPRRLDFKTWGYRWAGKLPRSFDYGMEVAAQTGALGADKVRAWAGHWLLGYTIAGARYKPRIIAGYNYASGDRDPGDGKHGTFDQLYPTGHDKYGLADQVGWRNIHHVRSGVEVKPGVKWLLIANFHSYWLASARDGLYNAGGVPVARSPDGAAGRRVGSELDGQVVCSLSKQIQIGGGFAHIFPGSFLKRATPGRAYNFPYWMVSSTF